MRVALDDRGGQRLDEVGQVCAGDRRRSPRITGVESTTSPMSRSRTRRIRIW